MQNVRIRNIVKDMLRKPTPYVKFEGRTSTTPVADEVEIDLDPSVIAMWFHRKGAGVLAAAAMDVDLETYAGWVSEELAIPEDRARRLKGMFAVFLPIEALFDADTMVGCMVGSYDFLGDNEAPIDLFAVDSLHTPEEALKLGSRVIEHLQNPM